MTNTNTAQTPAGPHCDDEAAVLATVGGMTAALLAGDVDTIMAAYTEDAVVLFEPATPTTGATAIRPAFAELAALAPRFDYAGHDVVIAGDVALHVAPWTMIATAPDGSEMTDAGLSVAVLRRTTAGWRIAVDVPDGAPA